MKVHTMELRVLEEGRGEELGHGHDSYYENSWMLYIPDAKLPLFKRQCHPGWRGWNDGGVGLCNYWVVASSCCPLLPEGTVCRLYTDDDREIGRL